MTPARAATEVRRPAAVVLQALRTAELLAAWDPSVVSVRQIEPGPPRDGSSARAWQRLFGLPLAFTWTLHEHGPGAVSWRRRGLRREEERRYEVTATADGARIEASSSGPDPVSLADLEADLGRIKAWLEEGAFAYPPGVDRSWGARLAGWLWASEAPLDLRAAPSSAAILGVELDRAHAPCTMYCHFCPRTAVKADRDLPPPTDAALTRVREGFERILDAWPAEEVTLWSDDVLRFPGVFDLVRAIAARGRRATLHTPGLALADPAFAERFVGLPVRFDLTVHAADAATTLAMCGNAGAHALIFQALDNLGRLGIPFKVAIVVTDRNIGAFGETLALLAAKYARDVIGVRVFFPDSLADRVDYTDQFPELAEVSRQLQRLRGTDTEVALANLPPCQMDPEDVAGVRVRLTPNHNAVRLLTFAACPTCPAREVCSGVHPRYVATRTAKQPDPARLRAVLDRCVVGDDAGVMAPQARLSHAGAALTRLPLHALGGATLWIGPDDEAQPWWIRGAQVSARFHLDEDCPPRRRAAVVAALERARPALAARGVTEPDLRAIASWVVETTRSVEG